MEDLRQKTVLITGASTGIGAATAEAFAAAGANLVLAARNTERLTTVAARLPGKPLVVPTDVSDPQQITRLIDQTLNSYPGIDLVISNAGVGLAAPVETLHVPDLEAAMTVNVYGPIWLTQAVLPVMRQQKHGHLMFVSSVVGWRALPYLGGYAAAKAALDRLTESLRVELRGSGIAVTLVRPGTTQTEFSQRRLGAGHERRRVSTRGVAPERVAAAILRAAQRRPRVAYVRFADRLTTAFGLLAPGLTDWALARSFSWDNNDE